MQLLLPHTIGEFLSYSRFKWQEAKEFGNALKAYRRVTNRKQNRVAVAFRLGSGEAISAEDWIVDHDGAHVDSHVTVAVRNSAGLVAEEIDDGTFVIPELLALNWELSPAMYVCSGDAEWRDDYFPVEEGWKDALATFDEVLQQGAFEDYLAIWRVHAILHEDRVGRSGRGAPADMMKPWLVLAIQTIEAYLRSDATDPNRAYPRARRALHFLRTF